MSLIEFQKIALKLYTNKEFQKTFLSDREKTLRENELTPREHDALMGLPEEELRLFYRELFHKRRDFMLAVLRRPEDPVVCSSFYIKSPVVMFRSNGSEQIKEISEKNFLLLEKMIGLKLTIKDLIRMYLSSPLAGPIDLLRIVAMFTRRALWGKKIRIV